MNSGKRRLLSYEERVLWATVTRAIEPLRGGVPVTHEAGDDEIAASPKPIRGLRGPKAAHIPPPARANPVPPLTPLGRRMRQRVARGKREIDARLDLHGLTQSEAHATLLRFLRNAHDRGARLVLVITGKGRGAEPGVLRRQVPQWLGLPEFRAFVIGFEDAHIAHGGEGALYVRVRRTRIA
jgi:DNA-nicking Smr family endonuclease